MEFPRLRNLYVRAFWMSLAMMLMVVLMMALMPMAVSGPAAEISVPLPLFRYLLYGVALLEIGVMLFLRRFLLGRPAAVKREREVDEVAVGQSLFTTGLVTFAIAESLAVYGLVLFLLSGDRRDLYLLGGLALAVMLALFPSYEKWKAHLEKAQMEELRAGAGVGEAR